MNNKPQITPGTTYMSNEGVPVTALRSISRDRALFVSEEFWPTPFVSWEYSFVSDNVINLYRGGYYRTLDDALNEINVGKSPILKLYPYCPDCGESRLVSVELYGTAQTIAETMSDDMICHECGQLIGAHKIEICDDDTTYEVPIYHGPTF